MATKYVNQIPTIPLMVLSLLLSLFLVIPSSFAGGAVTLVPADDQQAPQGSQIPKRRIKQIQQKVTEHKARLKEKATKQQQKQLPRNEEDESNVPKK